MVQLVAKIDLESALNRMATRMTLRVGTMLMAGMVAIIAILKLT
jgi:hypothetical protein